MPSGFRDLERAHRLAYPLPHNICPMPNLVPFPARMLAALAVAITVAGCQPASPHPVPSVPQIGGDLKCTQGDHPLEDQQAGWGFCYPGTWKYNERSQASQSPPGLDLTFDITNAPATPIACPSSSGPQTGCSGLFAFMIISTYERGSAADLSAWVAANLKQDQDLQSISWGNSVQAVRLADGRRLALTPHHVVILDLHTGLLDLEAEMSSRLSTWKFSY
jgi:hypothetical protein